VRDRDREFLEGLVEKWGVPIIGSEELRAFAVEVRAGASATASTR
jgi:hypothetical protein